MIAKSMDNLLCVFVIVGHKHAAILDAWGWEKWKLYSHWLRSGRSRLLPGYSVLLGHIKLLLGDSVFLGRGLGLGHFDVVCFKL